MKGIILAGGAGSRLHPSTTSISKQLLPIYDKPLIYYPLSIMMLADIRDILIICADSQTGLFRDLLKDGSQLGINISYMTQDNPNGIGEAFLIGEDFIGKDSVALVLGDNILWGQGLTKNLHRAKRIKKGANIFSYQVNNPEAFGVVVYDNDGKPKDIIEKPKNNISNHAIPGIYFYDNSVIQRAYEIEPSSRGELEITDINKSYLADNMLNAHMLGRGYAWLDTGDPELMLEASNFVRTIEKRQGTKIACLEEIAFNKSWIDLKKLKNSIRKMPTSSYKDYLRKIFF